MSNPNAQLPVHIGEDLDREVAAGARMSITADPDDSRWVTVTVRIPSPTMWDPNAAPIEAGEWTGDRARWRFIRMMAAMLAAIGTQMGLPAAFSSCCRLIHQETRVREASIEEPREEG